MFDTMTLTKITAGVCGALLVFLLGNWAAKSLYATGSYYGEQSYIIETDDDDSAEEVVELAFADVFATADAGAGEKAFRQCSACHKLEDGSNAVGPHLFGVVGREIGVVDGFAYSAVLADNSEAWTPENLNGFIEKPKDWAPGTKMAYNGMRDIEDRANLIAYLATIGN